MKTTTDHFNTFFEQATNVLPKSLLSLHQDLEKNLRVALDAALRKMNLVTREEFEVQKAVLAKTRSKLETLEKTVAEIEQQLTQQEEQ